MTRVAMWRWLTRDGASSTLIAVGSVLLVFSATSVARGAIARDAARSEWAQGEAKRAALGLQVRPQPFEHIERGVKGAVGRSRLAQPRPPLLT